MATQTIVETTAATSPDTSITKTEKFNASRLAQLLNSPNVNDADKRILRAIKKGAHNLCFFNTTYKLGKKVKMDLLGRYYAVNGVGGQTLPHDIRSALYGEFYYDVDMFNAQPTILSQYCKKIGFACNTLMDYVENRDARIQEVCEFIGCSRAEAKRRITQIVFGGSADGMPEFFSTLFSAELKAIRQNIWDTHKEKFKSLAKQPNFLMSATAHVLQTEETKCLLAMDMSFAKNGYSMDVLIHDGGLVARKDKDTELPETLLRNVEADVLASTGYAVKLVIKPMDTTIEFQDEKDEYIAWKTEFEKTHFRLLIPQCFAWLDETEGLQLLSEAQLVHNEAHAKMSDGKAFIMKWIREDESILTYKKLVFCPKQEAPPNCFNIFDGFGNIPAIGDFSAFTELVGIVANHDASVEAYLHNLFARMIQKPYEKSGVCVCLIGNQGVGKTVLAQKVGKIFGPSYFYETTSPQNNVFHTFNSGTERCIMLFMDEVDFKVNKMYQSKLKTLITSDKETYTKKGHDGIVLDDFRNVFMATNHRLPFVVEDTDRRMVAIECSSERMGQTEWWEGFVKKLDEQVSAYHHHLLNLDISKFNPRRDRPITEAYKDIKSQTSIPYHAGFFQKVVCDLLTRSELVESEEVATKTWKAADLHKDMSEFLGDKFDLSATRMGLDVRKTYDRVGGVDKHIGMLCATYTLYPNKCMEFLKEKGWWVM